MPGTQAVTGTRLYPGRHLGIIGEELGASHWEGLQGYLSLASLPAVL